MIFWSYRTWLIFAIWRISLNWDYTYFCDKIVSPLCFKKFREVSTTYSWSWTKSIILHIENSNSSSEFSSDRCQNLTPRAWSIASQKMKTNKYLLFWDSTALAFPDVISDYDCDSICVLAAYFSIPLRPDWASGWVRFLFGAGQWAPTPQGLAFSVVKYSLLGHGIVARVIRQSLKQFPTSVRNYINFEPTAFYQ